MLSPYWAHRDVETFPEPETFNPVSYIRTGLSLAATDLVSFNYESLCVLYRIDGWGAIWRKTSFWTGLSGLEAGATSALAGQTRFSS